MKLKLLIVICFTAALSVYAAAPNFKRSAAQQKMPGKMDLPCCVPNEKYGNDKYGKVPFDHQQHLPFSDCVYCHHTNKGLTLDSFNGGKSDRVPLCIECHARVDGGDEKTAKNKAGEKIWAEPAYHINCKDCHQGEITKIPEGIGMSAIKKKGEGPTKCAECHEKKD